MNEERIELWLVIITTNQVMVVSCNFQIDDFNLTTNKKYQQKLKLIMATHLITFESQKNK